MNQRALVFSEKLSSPGKGDLRPFVDRILPKLKWPCLILLQGDLGAGKTYFTRELLRALGVEEVMSPSFSLENNYESQKGEIHHFDLYRLESEDEIESSGLWDAFSSTGLVIVEWPQRVNEEHWPMSWPLWKVELKMDHSLELKAYAALT